MKPTKRDLEWIEERKSLWRQYREKEEEKEKEEEESDNGGQRKSMVDHCKKNLELGAPKVAIFPEKLPKVATFSEKSQKFVIFQKSPQTPIHAISTDMAFLSPDLIPQNTAKSNFSPIRNPLRSPKLKSPNLVIDNGENSKMLSKRGTKSPRLVDRDSVCDNDSTVICDNDSTVITDKKGIKSPKVSLNGKNVLKGCDNDNDTGENPLNVMSNVGCSDNDNDRGKNSLNSSSNELMIHDRVTILNEGSHEIESYGVPEEAATRESKNHEDKEAGKIVVNKENKNEQEIVLFNKIDKMIDSKRREDKENKIECKSDIVVEVDDSKTDKRNVKEVKTDVIVDTRTDARTKDKVESKCKLENAELLPILDNISTERENSVPTESTLMGCQPLVEDQCCDNDSYLTESSSHIPGMMSSELKLKQTLLYDKNSLIQSVDKSVMNASKIAKNPESACPVTCEVDLISNQRHLLSKCLKKDSLISNRVRTLEENLSESTNISNRSNVVSKTGLQSKDRVVGNGRKIVKNEPDTSHKENTDLNIKSERIEDTDGNDIEMRKEGQNTELFEIFSKIKKKKEMVAKENVRCDEENGMNESRKFKPFSDLVGSNTRSV